MEVHRQTCQSCGSIDVRNILRRTEGQRTAVFVRCARCKKLVARYELAAYYHHGKDVESWLRGYEGAAAMESGRDLSDAFARSRDQALHEYDEVLVDLARVDKEV